MDTIRVLRVLEYVGPRDKVEDTLKRCMVPINGSRGYGDNGVTIHSVILEGFAEVISDFPNPAIVKGLDYYLDRETGFFLNGECSVCHEFVGADKVHEHREACKYDQTLLLS